MLTSVWTSVVAGSVLGFLSGIGIGGGSLLMLWLTVLLNIPHPAARMINLLFFIPSALIASLFRRTEGNLKIRKVLPAIISGCICAAVFSLISKAVNPDYVRRLFGILLLITGLRELFYRKKETENQ